MRLNNKIRQTILIDILNRAFRKYIEKFEEERNVLAQFMYDNTVDQEVAKQIRAQVPQDWQPRCWALDAGDDELYDYLNYHRWNWDSSELKILHDVAYLKRPQFDFIDVAPFKDLSGGRLKILPTKEILSEVKKFSDKVDKLRDELETMHDTVSATLYGMNTKAQLVAAWPEVGDLVPEPVAKPKTAIVDVKTLLTINRAAGLPPATT